MSSNPSSALPGGYGNYFRDGYAVLDFHASLREIREVENYIADRVRNGHEGNIYDGAGRLRALHGYDRQTGLLAELMPRLAGIARTILGCASVYVYQFRVNVKNGTPGMEDSFGAWKPHRDFDYWQKIDGMDEPRAVIFHMLVNEHHAANGPLEVCPGTHEHALSEGELLVAPETDWKAGFSENIKYQIRPDAFSRAHSVPIHGKPGTLLAMHPMLWHASSPNTTDEPRVLLSIVFNDLDNVVVCADRPGFIVQHPDLGTW